MTISQFFEQDDPAADKKVNSIVAFITAMYVQSALAQSGAMEDICLDEIQLEYCEEVRLDQIEISLNAF